MTTHEEVQGKPDGVGSGMKRLIDTAIEAEMQEKQASKSGKRKCVRFSETNTVHQFDDASGEDEEPDNIGQQEDGPVKEHLLGEVYQRRQQSKDGRLPGQDQEELERFDVGAGEVAEENAEYEALDGEQISAFNMREEEEEGYDMATGELHRGTGQDDDVDQDPWLQSLQPAQGTKADADTGMLSRPAATYVVSDSIKQKIEEEKQAVAERKPLSDEELAEARRVLVSNMNARETVMAALSRHSKGIKSQQTVKGRLVKMGDSEERRETAALIDSMSEAASSLLSQEADIFEQRKEEIEHALSMFDLLRPSAPAGDGGNDSSSCEDMFANSDDDAHATAAQTVPTTEHLAPASEAGPTPSSVSLDAAVPAPHVVAPVSAAEVNYSGWPISELKRMLTEAHVPIEDAVDKQDLVEKAKQLEIQRAANSQQVPAGFFLDSASGYFYNSETSWVFDASSGCYFLDGKWYMMDATSGHLSELTIEG